MKEVSIFAHRFKELTTFYDAWPVGWSIKLVEHAFKIAKMPVISHTEGSRPHFLIKTFNQAYQYLALEWETRYKLVSFVAWDPPLLYD